MLVFKNYDESCNALAKRKEIIMVSEVYGLSIERRSLEGETHECKHNLGYQGFESCLAHHQMIKKIPFRT